MDATLARVLNPVQDADGPREARLGGKTPRGRDTPDSDIVAPYTAYGGDLRLFIHNDRLEVWLREPDKSKSPSGTLWPSKAEVLVYSTRPTLPSNFWTFKLESSRT